MNGRLERTLQTTVFLGALATIPLTVVQERGVTSAWVGIGDWLVWAVFFLEYVVMMARTPERGRYVREHRLDLAIVVLSFPLLPALLALSRLARLVRLFRLVRLGGTTVRGVQSLGHVLGRSGLVYVTSVTGFLIIAGGASLAALEAETVGGGFWEGIWWAVVTVTTVGYGDIAPATFGGRVVGVVLMITGVGLISTLAASISAYFVAEDSEADLKSVVERLDRIEALLQQKRVDEPRSSSR